MKPITPAEALGKKPDITEDVASSALHHAAGQTFVIGPRSIEVAVHALLGATPAIREQVMRTFRTAGWQVDFGSDQRDGSWARFTPARTGR